MGVYPPPLAKGSVVRVVAPASPFDATLVWRGLGWLAERYRVRFERRIFERHGYLAGSDERRRAELAQALAEPEVAAIFSTRGGYGSTRLVHDIDWSLLKRAPRWIVGFSDVTALHVEAARQGVASLHASNVGGLGRGDARAREALIDALERPRVRRVFDALETLVPGRASGTVFGGNLTLLHACATAGRLVLPESCILLLEDVAERPYRIDRMLTSLTVGGHLARVVAVVLGEFDRCAPGDDGVRAEEVLRERLAALAVPIVSGLPVGHGRDNAPVILGARAELVASSGVAQLTIGDL